MNPHLQARSALAAGLLVAGLWVQPTHAALVTSRADLAGDDLIDWAQLGPALGVVPNGAPVSTAAGLGASLGNGAGGIQRLDQGLGWGGNFKPADALVFNSTPGSYFTIAFDTPVQAVGMQLQASAFGAFTGQIAVYDTFFNTVESWSLLGWSSSDGDGSALFMGISRAQADIKGVLVGVNNASGVYQPMAMNRVDLRAGPASPNAVPEPAGWALAGLGLALAAASRPRRRSGAPGPAAADQAAGFQKM